MAYVRSKNRALTFYTSGRFGQSLEGLQDIAGQALSRFDTAVERAVIGLKRRASPAVSRAVRENYNIGRGHLADAFRIEEGTRRKNGDLSGYIAIWASTRQLPLAYFGGRWGGRNTTGATAEIARGSRKTYTSAFMAPGRIRGKAQDLIYTRIKGRKTIQKYGRYKGRMRESIRAMRGPSPFEMLSGVDGYTASIRTRDALLSEMRDFYINELRRQFALRNK